MDWDALNASLDKMTQWPMAIKSLVLILGWTVLVSVGYWVTVRAPLSQYQIEVAKESLLRREFELKQHQTSHVRVFREQVHLLQTQFDEAMKKMTPQALVPGTLDMISKIGTRCGLYFESFVPLRERQLGFYSELPIKMVMFCSYQQLVVFLNQIANINQLISWHDFVITKASLNRLTSKDQLMVNVTAKLYRPTKRNDSHSTSSRALQGNSNTKHYDTIQEIHHSARDDIQAVKTKHKLT